jgi:hypothetical protein
MPRPLIYSSIIATGFITLFTTAVKPWKVVLDRSGVGLDFLGRTWSIHLNFFEFAFGLGDWIGFNREIQNVFIKHSTI